MHNLRVGLLIFSSLCFLACAAKTFPGSEIPDTLENRELLKIVSQYQQAMEEKDTDLLLSLASPQYHEDSGTITLDDDYGLDGLRTVLSQRFSSIDQIRYTVRVKEIQQQGDRAYIDIHYEILFQFTIGETKRWHSAKEDGRLELEKMQGGWKIFSGM